MDQRAEAGLDYWLGEKLRGRMFYAFGLSYLKVKNGTIRTLKDTVVFHDSDQGYIESSSKYRSTMESIEKIVPSHYIGFTIIYTY